jgi:transcriptional regulator with XRE-family HTH domain
MWQDSPVEIEDLGSRLRQQRVAASRTIASVAAEAGLSVPYIANLENGRGNPTLTAVNRLAAALGVRLAVDMVNNDRADGGRPQALPETLVQFSRSPRFLAETTRLAQAAQTPEATTRQRLLHAMTVMGALTGRPMSELDLHRVLDTVVLITAPNR